MPFPHAEIKTHRLSLVILLGFLVLWGYLFYMQVLRYDYYRSLSEKNRLRVVFLEGARGEILDRKGRLLAANQLSFNCSIIPGEAKSTIHESIRVIASILGEDPQVLEKAHRVRKPGVFNTVLLAEDIDREKAVAIEEAMDSMPGVLIETRPQRRYPYGEACAHVVGYTGPMTDEEKRAARDEEDYRSSDWLGRDGVEKFYENQLRGVSGGLQMEVNSRGRFLRALGVREPKEGRSIQLTVDARLQEMVQKQIQGKKGAVIVMDLSDGGILSLNSSPSFDSNLFSTTRGRRHVGKYLRGKNSPMLNRAVRGQYPPGSIFKIVTALAGLESGRISMGSAFDCPGFLMVGGNRFGCWAKRGHGRQGLTDATAHSCDVFFYMTGLAVGVDGIFSKAVEFGLGQKLGIDLPSEGSGTLPSREWKKKRNGQPWFDGDTANLSIGQGFLQMTPLQAVVMVGAVAEAGDVLKPHLIDKIAGVRVGERRAARFSVTPKFLGAVRSGLDAAVQSDSGTGRLARIPDARVVGKTGTAQSGQPEDHAWFVGYAPDHDPKVALVVFVENGGHGGVVAAGIAHDIFLFLKSEGYL